MSTYVSAVGEMERRQSINRERYRETITKQKGITMNQTNSARDRETAGTGGGGSRHLGRGDDTVGNPHRAQISRSTISQFELFELILLLKLDTVPWRAIRSNSISVSSTLLPMNTSRCSSSSSASSPWWASCSSARLPALTACCLNLHGWIV